MRYQRGILEPKIGHRFLVQCWLAYKLGVPVSSGHLWRAHQDAYKQLIYRWGAERIGRWQHRIKRALDNIERQAQEDVAGGGDL